MRTYIVTLRHTDTSRFPSLTSFIIETWNESRAVIAASDAYRATFGQPERGTSHGIRWVNCDFMEHSTARFIPLRVVR